MQCKIFITIAENINSAVADETEILNIKCSNVCTGGSTSFVSPLFSFIELHIVLIEVTSLSSGSPYLRTSCNKRSCLIKSDKSGIF